MRTPQLIYPITSNIEGCEDYTMGLLIPYKVMDICAITKYIDDNVDKQMLDKAYALYGDVIITHMIVIEQLNRELFNNQLKI